MSVLDLGLPHSPPGGAGKPAAVLTVGDGDFSYSLALLNYQCQAGGTEAFQLTATSYDSTEDLHRMYPHAQGIIDQLRSKGVTVLHGVDARGLSAHFPPETVFDRVVFMFPQSPPAKRARNMIQNHRNLLRGFLQSAVPHLVASERSGLQQGAAAPQATVADGQVWITLLQGQGGTDLEEDKRGFKNSWQLSVAAAESGLIMFDVHRLDIARLVSFGYHSKGYQNSNKGFLRKGQYALTHVLRAPDPVQQVRRTRAVSPPIWTFDNSFWVDFPSPPDAAASSGSRSDDVSCSFNDEVFRIAAAVCPPDTLFGAPKMLDAYTEASTNRNARTIRFLYCSSFLPLAHSAARAINDKVHAALKAQYEREGQGKVSILPAFACGGGHDEKKTEEQASPRLTFKTQLLIMNLIEVCQAKTSR